MLIRLAWRNLWRGWRRSAVVLVAITVGLAACLLMVSWTRGLMEGMGDNAVRTHLAHLAVQARGYQADPEVDRVLGDGGAAALRALEGRPGVRAAPRLLGDGLVQSARASARSAIVGVDPAREPGVSSIAQSVVEGEYLPAAVRTRGVRRLPPILIGVAMAERLRLGLGDKLVVHVPGETGLGAFRVRGLFRTSSSEFDKSVAFVPLGEAQRLFDVSRGVTAVAIALDEPDEMAALQAELVGVLASGPEPVEVLTWRERERRLASMLDVAGSTYWIFYAAIFVAMAFGIANALLMSVFERAREFGVLRSLGLGSRKLVALVLCESLLLTLVGVALGIAVGIPLVLWLGSVGIDLAMFSDALLAFGMGAVMYPKLGLDDIYAPILLAVVTALLAGLWPAIKVARLRPAQALRHH